MGENTRRDFLQKSVVAVSGTTIIGSAKASKPGKQGLRLRRGKDKPIKPNEIAKKKRKILQKQPKSNMGKSPIPRRGSVDLSEHEHIVAYNLDVIEGAPYEWVGVYQAKPKPEQISHKNPSNGKQIGREDKIIQNIHEKADEHARSNNAGTKRGKNDSVPMEI